MLVNGVWTTDWQPVQDQDNEGRFLRQTSSFRHWITADGSAGPTGDAGFKAERDRYHLYVAYICPWASRALMVRQLKQLNGLISISVVNPRLSSQGWEFGGYPDASEDTLNAVSYLHQLYTQVSPHYTGRATVPVLWDKHTHCIVNNESADIIRMLNNAFADYSADTPDLYPASLSIDIDLLNQRLYSDLNNGVYQAGFATTQQAYAEAYTKVFSMLDELETRLADGRRFLFGDALTESDVRLFVSLIRFDVAYHGLFKCNRNTIKSMRNLYRYMKRILALNGIAETVNIEHIKAGYYSIRTLNPNGLVPLGPDLDD